MTESNIKVKKNCTVHEPIIPLQLRAKNHHVVVGRRSKIRLILATTSTHIEHIRKLNEAVLPVQYDNYFYQKLLSPKHVNLLAVAAGVNDEEEAKVVDQQEGSSIYCNNSICNDSVVVAAVSCVHKTFQQRLCTYILSLVVVPSFRRKGIATVLMDEVQQRQLENPHVCGMFLHTQVNNRAGLKLYEKLGFDIVQEVSNYYNATITPRNCFVLRKSFKAIRRQMKKARLNNFNDRNDEKNINISNAAKVMDTTTSYKTRRTR